MMSTSPKPANRAAGSASHPASFAPDDGPVATGPLGQVGHLDLIDHTDRLGRRLWAPRPGVWCLIGNGLSNQTFVEGPDGLIAIDTGESTQEMAAALAEVRQHTPAPVVAVVYTHFHYVAGTAAILEEAGRPDGTPLEVWGHERIVANRQRYGLEVSAVAGRGLVHQFGVSLPPEGPDALINVGLGLFFRDPGHAPFTDGFLPPDHTMVEPMTAAIAGLTVEMTPAPSDADDNITLWFPELGVCVNNLVWPALFNIFAIRGEEYRDPRVLLTGLDHVADLGADHLLGAHGPPLSGRDQIAREVIDYRDSIQYLWDQTVRGINRGLTMDELTEQVQLPDRFDRSYLTRQFYGLVEHHVRQIHVGLRGWFDGDESSLFPLPHAERHRRLVDGFGGPEVVRAKARQALQDDDLRWAIELASWLVRSDADDGTEVGRTARVDGGTTEDRGLLAEVLRAVAQRTTSSNARNWCLTRALELEGSLDLDRHRIHRFARGTVLGNPLTSSVGALRVVLDPARAAGADVELRWELEDGQRAGLRLRHGVAVPTDGSAADLTIALDLETWADVLAAKATVSEALAAGRITTDDPDRVRDFFACFDSQGLR